MTEDDLPDPSFFRYERSPFESIRPLDDPDAMLEEEGCVDDDGDGDGPYGGESGMDALDHDDLDRAIDELIRDILHTEAASPSRSTAPRFRDHRSAQRTGGASQEHRPLADRLLEFVYAHLDGVSVMIASTASGTGAYGRLTVDPLHSTEVRLFGWPRLQPHSPDADRSAITSLLRLGFAHDNGDWVWRAAPVPHMVPVAAHAAQRAIAEAWRIGPHEATPAHIRLYTLDTAQIMLIAAGVLCSWCADSGCPGASAH